MNTPEPAMGARAHNPQVATVAMVATNPEVATVARVASGPLALATSGHLAVSGGHPQTQQNCGSGHSGHRGHLPGRDIGIERHVSGKKGPTNYYLLEVARVARVATALICQWVSSGHLVGRGGQRWLVAFGAVPDRVPRPNRARLGPSQPHTPPQTPFPVPGRSP